MKKVVSIFFIFLCVTGEIAVNNLLLYNSETPETRYEERAGGEIEQNLLPVIKVKTATKREPTAARPLITKRYVQAASIAETENEVSNIQSQLHSETHRLMPMYLVKKVFLI
jgi:hypothetical protein